jgi:monoamine oxidase
LASSSFDIIIVGAGACGLMAMNELVQAGYKVLTLEANGVAGGRIATIKKPGFAQPIETGAEFIHGKLRQTFKILRKAAVKSQLVKGRFIGSRNGRWDEQEEHADHWDELLGRMRILKTDMTIRDFLDKYFPGRKYAELQLAVQRFAEGFDLADISKASVFSVRKEWRHEHDKQFRINGGYGQLIDYLAGNALSAGGIVKYNTGVKQVNYDRGRVNVVTATGREFRSEKIIVTSSIGYLQSGELKFHPEPLLHSKAIREIGFGSIIKIFFQFRRSFWKDYAEDLGFLLSDKSIPTWWTQLPSENNLLTGWLGGPKANRYGHFSDIALINIGIRSLSGAFHIPQRTIRGWLEKTHVSNWRKMPYVKGGYSYSTIFTPKAVEILAEPVLDTLFFAGEAIHKGESQGTVEAALLSGLDVAKKIRKYSQ